MPIIAGLGGRGNRQMAECGWIKRGVTEWWHIFMENVKIYVITVYKGRNL